MLWLAVKTLFHEKVRLITTLVGITFSNILTLTQVGMYFGFMGNASTIIRHTDADGGVGGGVDRVPVDALLPFRAAK